MNRCIYLAISIDANADANANAQWEQALRVAMAQGKQGIWLLTFPDRENTGNLVNLIFYTGKFCQHRENLEFFESVVINVATR